MIWFDFTKTFLGKPIQKKLNLPFLHSVNCMIIQKPCPVSALQSCACRALAQEWMCVRAEQLDAGAASGMSQLFPPALRMPSGNALYASGQEKQENLCWIFEPE